MRHRSHKAARASDKHGAIAWSSKSDLLTSWGIHYVSNLEGGPLPIRSNLLCYCTKVMHQYWLQDQCSIMAKELCMDPFSISPSSGCLFWSMRGRRPSLHMCNRLKSDLGPGVQTETQRLSLMQQQQQLKGGREGEAHKMSRGDHSTN